MVDYKKILHSEQAKTAAATGLVIIIVLGAYFGLSMVLGTQVPVRVVTSGSMCLESNGCDGYSHAFSPTLHVGDLIIIQSVKAEDLNANYPNSDIIVYQNPDDPTAIPIVHRIVTKYLDNAGVWHFQTKGDGNDQHYPASPPDFMYDSHMFWTTGEGVSQDHVYGKVIMRIPYVGLISIFIQSNQWVLPTIIALILLAVIVQYSLPKIRSRLKKTQ